MVTNDIKMYTKQYVEPITPVTDYYINEPVNIDDAPAADAGIPFI